MEGPQGARKLSTREEAKGKEIKINVKQEQ
jgi:hypothetical protein